MRTDIEKLLDNNLGNSAENIASEITKLCNIPHMYEYLLDFLVIGGPIFDKNQIVDYIMSTIKLANNEYFNQNSNTNSHF